MKKSLFLMLIAAMAIAFAGCNKDDDESAKTPPLAATTQTWTFGEQTWSDAIHCPECNKETFENSDSKPDCRSYTENSKTWYYYNGGYVNANKNTMCPDPWRVPTKEDFDVLVSNTAASTLIDAWGYGGTAGGYSSSVTELHSIAYYWSSTEDSSNTDYAYLFVYANAGLHVGGNHKLHGYQVRCVK